MRELTNDEILLANGGRCMALPSWSRDLAVGFSALGGGLAGGVFGAGLGAGFGALAGGVIGGAGFDATVDIGRRYGAICE